MLRTVRSLLLSLVASLVVVGVLATPASALLIGAPTFTIAPNTALGTITLNTLTITPFPNGMQVAGQIQVTVPSTTTGIAGILLDYQVDYPIDPAYPFNPGLFTTTAIDGFSAPPPGVVGTTAGFVHSNIVTLPSTDLVPSISNIPLTLVAGVDNPPWLPAIVANSGVFPFTGATGMVLRQRLTLDGIYSSGPGGIWTIDLPVQTFVSEVPEPSTLALTVLGLTGLGLLGFRQKFLGKNPRFTGLRDRTEDCSAVFMRAG